MADSVLAWVDDEPRASGREAAGSGVVGIVGGPTKGNLLLEQGWQRLGLTTRLMSPSTAATTLGKGDIVLVRLDVLGSLDGIEPGLGEAAMLARRGARVLNRPSALFAVHDKLVTYELLAAAGVAHPATVHVTDPDRHPDVPMPCVVKPRLGSWGKDVFRCSTLAELSRTLRSVRDRPWFRRHGALVQELLPTPGVDLRVLVAGGRVVGAARRVAAAGEWRTNVTLGGSLEPVAALPDDAAALSLAAVAVVGADLVGVDVLPTMRGPVVLELNGAADFDERYSLPDEDVYLEAASALRLPTGVTTSGR